MIQELKELLIMVENVPEMVIHVLMGFAAYKIIIFLGTSAGIYGTIRLGINKTFEYKTKKLEAANCVKYSIDGRFISPDVKDKFETLLSEMRGKSTGPIGGQKTRLLYIHASDVELLTSLLRKHEEENRRS